jgi:hypothetical protein
VVIYDRDISKIRLYYQTPLKLAIMSTYSNRKYGIEVSDVNMTTVTNREFDVKYTAGTITVLNDTKYKLRAEGDNSLSAVEDEESNRGAYEFIHREILVNY